MQVRDRKDNRKGAVPQMRLALLVDQWCRMGQFYASLEAGHVTASIALKRLTGFTEKNHFYRRANVELGRILKTEDTSQTQTNQQRVINR